MDKSIFRYILFSILLLVIQITVLNNIQFSGYVNPYIYVMIIMLLPLGFPQWALLLTAFATGLVVDAASGTLGIHTSSTVLAGFVRPFILTYMAPRDGYEQGAALSMRIHGFRWFAVYAGWVILIHHTALFYIEVFRFAEFFRTFLRVLLSSGFSLIFVLLTEYYRKLR
ncbi:MAG: rod shape-determining protein MreD [Bacteroidetes bacterium]|nr:rod shape-determining protein MreD [Bacteroidota bacterium]